jgi:hypothetical protein
MDEVTSAYDRFNWWLSFCVAGCGLLAVMLVALSSPFNFFQMGYYFLLVPLIGLALLGIAIASAVRKKHKRSLSILLAMALYCGSSWWLFRNSIDVRANERWLLHSKKYKAEVLAQPSPKNGELQHMEWDGWGFPGAGDTVVYLVYDPQDSLLPAAKSNISGKFKGISCEVVRVRRLESHWYSVLFYTDTAWDNCNCN